MRAINQKPEKYFKTMPKIIQSFVCPDETRRALFNTVNHNEDIKSLVMTDGHTALILPSLYDENLKGISLNVKELRVNPNEFPRIKTIYSGPEVMGKMKTLGVKLIEKQIAVKSSPRGKPNMTYFYENCITMTKLEEDKKLLFALNSDYLARLIGFQVEIFYNDWKSPVILKLNDFNNDVAIIMPMKV